jgi:small subunit ribosomal protein S20
MANIKQQKKRIGITTRERVENLRYRSTVKTLVRRLRAAVDEGETTKIEAEHKLLVQWIDRATSRGAMHKNAAARKKSQADRLVASKR